MSSTGTPLARAFARLEIDAVDASSAVKSSVRQAGQGAGDVAESEGKQLGERLKKGLEFGAAFYGGQALFEGVTEGLKTVVEGADQLNEATERADRVFGSASEGVLKFGQDAAHSYGLSAAAADQASVKFGTLLENMNIPQAEAAKMSERLVGLSADLAQFYKIDPSQAEKALTSALAGRTQGLKQLGISIDAASISEEAYKLHLISSVKDALDPAAKAQATYQLILAGSTTQQGAFARSSGSLAVQVSQLKAEAENAAANIGQHLLPVLTDGAHILGADVIPAVEKTTSFFEHNEVAAAALATVVAYKLLPALDGLFSLGKLGGLEEGVAGLLSSFSKVSSYSSIVDGELETVEKRSLSLRSGFSALGDSLGEAFSAVNPYVLGTSVVIGGAIGIYEKYEHAKEAAAAATKTLVTALQDEASGQKDAVLSGIVKDLTDAGASDKLKDLGLNINTVAKALNENVPATNSLSVQISALLNAAANQGPAQLSKMVENLQNQFGDLNVTGTMTADVLSLQGDAIHSLGQVTNGTANTLKVSLNPGLADTGGKVGKVADELGNANKKFSEMAANAKTTSDAIAAAFAKSPDGTAFAAFVKAYQASSTDLQKAAGANTKTLAGQIDALTDYSTQAKVTAQDIQKIIYQNLLDAKNEGENLKTLGANGASPAFIEYLYNKGPEFVAGAASGTAPVQQNLSSLYGAFTTRAGAHRAGRHPGH